jgi:hypothetical protein
LIADVSNSNPEAIVDADVGFVFKNKIVYGGRTGAFFISGGNGTKAVSFTDAEYLYRISYNPNNPTELLISGQKTGGEIFSRILNPITRKLHELSVNGTPAYKAAFFDGDCYFAHRDDTDGFEDRYIVKANAYTLTELDYKLVLEIDI